MALAHRQPLRLLHFAPHRALLLLLLLSVLLWVPLLPLLLDVSALQGGGRRRVRAGCACGAGWLLLRLHCSWPHVMQLQHLRGCNKCLQPASACVLPTKE